MAKSKTDLDDLGLLNTDRPRTPAEDRALANACVRTITAYRTAVLTSDGASKELTERARAAFLHLGGDPTRSSASLKDYDHERDGPFLGVSDEGGAAGAIRDAALDSPKVRALSADAARDPLRVGVAVDAERLGGVGEVNVGRDEYADVWLQCVDRVLITTNVATRVNMRVYRREPIVTLASGDRQALANAKAAIAEAFKPFVETPDLKPRPLTVFVDIPANARMTTTRKRTALKALVEFVSSGQAAGKEAAPPGQQLGLSVWTKLGPPGRDQAIAAIELAANAGIHVVVIDGVKRKAADRAVSLAGLLDYFEPGLVGPILRAAKRSGVRVRTANLPDTDTIARSTWVGLTTARSCGANLGKYGCFPLTLDETDAVVEQIQQWFPHWSAAPVCFVDQGVIRDDGVDVGNDLMRGLRFWLETMARHQVRVVLIDTVDKASGRRLLRKSSKDDRGFLSTAQILKIQALAQRLGIKVLWAGGLSLGEAFEMGRLGVFGIYVTSAAATLVPVSGIYVRDPALAGRKQPSRDAVRRTKILMEAGFLSARLTGDDAAKISALAADLLAALEQKDAPVILEKTEALSDACVRGWSAHWKSLSA